MKAFILLFAVIAQLLCLIVAASKFGIEAGVYVLVAIIANAIQAVSMDSKDKK